MERKIKVEKVNYKDSPLFCNLKLTQEMDPKEMEKNQAVGSEQIVGFTRKEAETTHSLLGKILGKKVI